MKTDFLSVFCLAPRDWAITIEFNILDPHRGDEEMKREKMLSANAWLLKFWATLQLCLNKDKNK